MSKYWIDPETGLRVTKPYIYKTFHSLDGEYIGGMKVKCLTPDKYYNQLMIAYTLHEQNNELI